MLKHRSQPGLFSQTLGLVFFDRLLVARKRNTDVVKTIHHGPAAERRNVKVRGRTARFDHQLLIKINRELVTGRRLAVFEQAIQNQFGDRYGQQAVFERIGIENIRK